MKGLIIYVNFINQPGKITPLFPILYTTLPIYVYLHSKVPAYLNIVDIAGLVKGAHEGQGLGNAFLSHIRSVDAIFHLCRKKY